MGHAPPCEAALAENIRRLTRERDQYFGVLESLSGPVFITTEEGRLQHANDAALQSFLGLSEAGALRYRLALQHHRDTLQAVLDDILAAGRHELHAIWLDTHAGRRCFDIRLRPLEDSASKLDRCLIILMNDVTGHQRAIERARQAEHTMSMFLAAMSHEIRGPLHSVLGAAELLRDASLAEAESLLDLLGLSAGALNATLENVLSFSRFRHQAPQPRPTAVPLRKMLADLVRTQDVQARHQGVPLQLQLPAELPEQVMLDGSLVQQVLGNLVRNALRHDDGQGVTLAVKIDGSELVFIVTDHGPGLPPGIQAQLTRPASAASTPLPDPVDNSHSSGLGMLIVRRMTQALGGRLQLPADANGTSIEVWLPLVLPEIAAPDTNIPAPPPEAPVLDQSCLLLDDDPIGALGTMAMLERLVRSVDHATSLTQASALLQTQPDVYDFFIVDTRLPDGNGLDFARQIRLDPRMAGKPVLLLSANTEQVRQQPEAGMLFAALLEKPLDATALAQAIRRHAGPPPSSPNKEDTLSIANGLWLDTPTRPGRRHRQALRPHPRQRGHLWPGVGIRRPYRGRAGLPSAPAAARQRGAHHHRAWAGLYPHGWLTGTKGKEGQQKSHGVGPSPQQIEQASPRQMGRPQGRNAAIRTSLRSSPACSSSVRSPWPGSASPGRCETRAWPSPHQGPRRRLCGHES